jgi:hypothetical protein
VYATPVQCSRQCFCAAPMSCFLQKGQCDGIDLIEFFFSLNTKLLMYAESAVDSVLTLAFCIISWCRKALAGAACVSTFIKAKSWFALLLKLWNDGM